MPSAVPETGSDHIVTLTGLYPAVSHTFILREVMALRAAGLQVTTCSVNRPGSGHLIGPAEVGAAQSTYYLLANARRPAVLLAALVQAGRRPARLARALATLRHSGARGLRENLRQVAYLIEAVVLARFLIGCRATRIHNQLGMASASVSMYAAILAGIPFSFTLHGPDDFFEAPARQLPAKIAAADFVACISQFCRNQARQFCNEEDRAKLHIIRCGVDPDAYSPRDRTAPLRRILFVGRLVPVKNVPLLIRAFASIADDVPDATLTIVGDGPERAKLDAIVAGRGLQGRVVFTGALDQRQTALRMAEADAFVLPSLAEGLPVVLMEAMASGLPVIATKVAGTPELVEDGTTGRLVTAGDEAQLASALRDLLADPAPALEMARRGRSRALRDHDMWEEGRRLAGLFVTGPSRAHPRDRMTGGLVGTVDATGAELSAHEHPGPGPSS